MPRFLQECARMSRAPRRLRQALVASQRTAPGDVTLQQAHVCARRAAHTLLLTSRHRLRHRDAM
ncbi:conserved hypothetical protein [Xanthomonas citri pv. bilvae]|nr:conserved hypothetical protein [Xanthomonas citri pv. bilvae]